MSAKQTLKQRKALRSAAATKPRRVRKHLGNGMSMLVSREEARKPREMRPADIGCWLDTSYFGDVLRVRFEEQELLKPSLWQRIKGWFA